MAYDETESVISCGNWKFDPETGKGRFGEHVNFEITDHRQKIILAKILQAKGLVATTGIVQTFAREALGMKALSELYMALDASGLGHYCSFRSHSLLISSEPIMNAGSEFSTRGLSHGRRHS